MDTSRSDQAYFASHQSAERFDYFVAGVAAALSAYVGQSLRLATFGPNQTTLEGVALVLFVAATIFALKRIEATVVVMKEAAARLYHGESAGAKLEASKVPTAINVSTGEIKTSDDLIEESGGHSAEAKARGESEKKWIGRAKALYDWRNRTLIGGLVLLAASRVLPALGWVASVPAP